MRDLTGTTWIVHHRAAEGRAEFKNTISEFSASPRSPEAGSGRGKVRIRAAFKSKELTIGGNNAGEWPIYPSRIPSGQYIPSSQLMTKVKPTRTPV